MVMRVMTGRLSVIIAGVVHCEWHVLRLPRAVTVKVILRAILSSMSGVQIAEIVEGWIGAGIGVKRILLPVEIDEFDREKHGEKGEDEEPAQAKPKPVERNQNLDATDRAEICEKTPNGTAVPNARLESAKQRREFSANNGLEIGNVLHRRILHNLLPRRMEVVAGAGGVESHDGDLALKVDGAVEIGDDERVLGEQRPESLVDVVVGFHLLDALLQGVILSSERGFAGLDKIRRGLVQRLSQNPQIDASDYFLDKDIRILL